MLPADEGPLCKRCGLVEETEAHRTWECPCNRQLGLHSSDRIARRAVREHESLPSFWPRGILPSSWLDDIPQPPLEQDLPPDIVLG